MSEQDDLRDIVAAWQLPTPEEVKAGVTKSKAPQKEMGERAQVTRWLVETAGRATSVRGVAYRAVALLDLPKTEKAFRYIEEMTLKLRDEGILPWDSIRDGRRSKIWHGRWPSLAERVRMAAASFTLDPWVDLPFQAQVWIEKQGLADSLSVKTDELGINLYPASGFTGASFLQAAIREAAVDGRPLLMFVLTDYDSSGNRMRETIEKRAGVFADELGVTLMDIVIVALTRDQIDEPEPSEPPLPTRPQKETTHTREGDDEEAVELDAVDALYPDLLGEWLEEAVEPYCSLAHREAVAERESADQDVLTGLADELDER